MNDNAGTQANLLRQFPLALQMDKQMQIMATVIAAAFAQRWPEAELGILYPAIDLLPERILDILAYDFKVDWWNPEYDLEEKRRTLKDSWRVHKTLGTKAAVETAISAVYPDTKVEEWFEYGGEPYRFRLWINLTDDDIDSERMRRVLDRLAYYKSLRSHVDAIYYFTEASMPQVQGNVLYTGCIYRLNTEVRSEPLPAPVYRAQAGAGIAVKALEAAMHKEIDMRVDIPGYRADTKAGVGIGMLCMSMDVFIEQEG